MICERKQMKTERTEIERGGAGPSRPFIIHGLEIALLKHGLRLYARKLIYLTYLNISMRAFIYVEICERTFYVKENTL